MANDKEVKKLIAKQLEAISKKYGKDRKTKLIENEEIEEYQEQNFIDDYPLTLFVTRDGYLKTKQS